MKTEIRLPSNGMINMPGMASNYKYARSVDDQDFIKLFESMWEDPRPGMFEKLAKGEYEVRGKDVFVTLEES